MTTHTNPISSIFLHENGTVHIRLHDPDSLEILFEMAYDDIATLIAVGKQWYQGYEMLQEMNENGYDSAIQRFGLTEAPRIQNLPDDVSVADFMDDTDERNT